MAQVKDPVCGMVLDDKDVVATSEYRGKRYSFCSQDCKAAFDKDPERYAGKA